MGLLLRPWLELVWLWLWAIAHLLGLNECTVLHPGVGRLLRVCVVGWLLFCSRHWLLVLPVTCPSPQSSDGGVGGLLGKSLP